MKPRVMSLVLFTSMVGLLIAPNQVSFLDSIISLAAIALGAGAAGTLNMWYESDLDALMSRTCLRPIPTGKLKKIKLYGLVLSCQFCLWEFFITLQISYQFFYLV